MKAWKWAVFIGGLLAGTLAAVWIISDQREQRRHSDTVEKLVESEELILALTPRLGQLGRGVRNRALPDIQCRVFFADQISVRDLGEAGAAESGPLGLETVPWSASESLQRTKADLLMWEPLFRRVDWFEHAKFYFIRGAFEGEETFRSRVGFRALARSQGRWVALRAEQDVVWKRGVHEEWTISEWKLDEFEASAREERLFEEVLDHLVDDPDDLARARRSIQEEYVVQLHQVGTVSLPDARYQRFFRPDAMGKHPAVSVVDIDGDGWDDLYVMERWGTNLLFRNQGDGTFREEAAAWGLDLEGLSHAAIFADFDNDGDPDVFIGRGLEPSIYLVNEGGQFTQRDDLVPPLPYLVTSISAADFNGDGLLDVYLSTYGLPERDLQDAGTARYFLDDQNAERMFQTYRESDASQLYLNAVGPPNLLLVNRGGSFEIASENEQVGLWHNTFQSTWADFDGDRDPDLYLSNDFAPDYLFRNDGPDGFVDVTHLGGEAMMGFGMGASWGDYDNDGRQDLYVSNMYSKAGMRITQQLPQLDARYRRSAEGNRLFRNEGERLTLVSGLAPPSLMVARADWSWGGQFVDVDNNGFLDLYVTSGYYSAPKPIAAEIDL